MRLIPKGNFKNNVVCQNFVGKKYIYIYNLTLLYEEKYCLSLRASCDTEPFRILEMQIPRS